MLIENLQSGIASCALSKRNQTPLEHPMWSALPKHLRESTFLFWQIQKLKFWFCVTKSLKNILFNEVL